MQGRIIVRIRFPVGFVLNFTFLFDFEVYALLKVHYYRDILLLNTYEFFHGIELCV